MGVLVGSAGDVLGFGVGGIVRGVGRGSRSLDSLRERWRAGRFT